jgi:exodeoxyribonuclease VII large subunit
MQRLQQHAQRLDELRLRLNKGIQLNLLHHSHKLEQLQGRLNNQSPAHRLERLSIRHQQLKQRLRRGIEQHLESQRQRLTQAARDLHNLSPLNTLGRGYAIVSRQEDGTIIRSYKEVKAGESLTAKLAQGSLRCRVEETKK